MYIKFLKLINLIYILYEESNNMSNIITIAAARITDPDTIRRAYELRKADKEFVSALLQNPKLPADVLVKIMGNDQMDKIE